MGGVGRVRGGGGRGGGGEGGRVGGEWGRGMEERKRGMWDGGVGEPHISLAPLILIFAHTLFRGHCDFIAPL